MSGPDDLKPDLIPFIPDYARHEPTGPTHYGYDAEFAVGAFTTQIGSYDA